MVVCWIQQGEGDDGHELIELAGCPVLVFQVILASSLKGAASEDLQVRVYSTAMPLQYA
jgi:hypothetical protein